MNFTFFNEKADFKQEGHVSHKSFGTKLKIQILKFHIVLKFLRQNKKLRNCYLYNKKFKQF